MTTLRPDADDAWVAGCLAVVVLVVVPLLVGCGLLLLQAYGAVLAAVGQWLRNVTGLGVGLMGAVIALSTTALVTVLAYRILR